MKYYSNLHNDKIIKQPKIVDLNIDENEKYNSENCSNKLMFSSGTPQLSNGKHQWGALYNPKNSKSTIYVESISIVNFSSIPIIQSQYLNPKINYEGFKYMYGNSNSLEYNTNSNGVVIFYQGNDNLLFLNEPNLLKISQPFYTDNSQKHGNIIIPPGKSILILINTMDLSNPSCAISYTWWEE